MPAFRISRGRRKVKRTPRSKTCGGPNQFACKLPTSGSELTYDPVLWGTAVAIANSNCISYALGDYSENRPIKATPGAYAVLRGDKRYARELGRLDCPSLTRRLLSDNPGKIYRSKAETPCKKGYYKIMLVATKKGSKRGDFHVLRANGDVKYPVQPGETLSSIASKFQVPVHKVSPINDRYVLIRDSGTWSQKAGFATGALLTDTCNKLIFDPRASCRGNGTDLYYKQVCGSFCVARCKTRTA